MSPVYVFTDLDDTLFQTERKCADLPRVAAAMDKAGAPLSFQVPAQSALLQLLAGASLIPVTGRHLPALQRVHAPVFDGYKVTSHGAVVLGADDAMPADWAADLDAGVERWAARFDDALTAAQAAVNAADGQLRARCIEDLGRPVYISVKGETAQLAAFAQQVRDLWPGLIHHNGENLALLPDYACKARAVAYLIERIRQAHAGEHPLFIGMGDSVTDMAFMALCHFAVVPQTSQICEAVWR